MASLEEENNVTGGVFGGVEFSNTGNVTGGTTENAGSTTFGGTWTTTENAGTIRNGNLPVKNGFWSKFKAFWLQEIDWNQEIKVELTPYQQKIEDEINEFLHQEITWEKVHNFLFKKI